MGPFSEGDNDERPLNKYRQMKKIYDKCIFKQVGIDKYTNSKC